MVRIGVIADPHVSVDERRHEYVTWHNVYRLAESQPAFVEALEHPLVRDTDVTVVLGDLVHWGDRESLAAVVEAADVTQRPVILLSGNHDVLERGVRLEQEIAARNPKLVWSPRTEAQAPDAIIEPFASADLGFEVVEVLGEHPGDGMPFGVEHQVLLERPRPDAAAVLLTHFPVLSLRTRSQELGLLYSGHLRNLAATPDALDVTSAPTLVLNGHLHIRGVRSAARARQISFAALIEPPYEIARVDIDGSNVRYECASLGPVPDDVKLPVLDGPSGSLPLA